MQFRSQTTLAALLASYIVGCGSAATKLGDERAAAYAAFNEAVNDFARREYAAAEPKLTSALAANLINPDAYCEATAKLAVCWGAAGKYPEALAELDKLGPAAPNQAEIFAARSFILKKQGKLAEANVALAQARRLNRLIKEF